jgi:transcriptional regulator with XRE-family HTH domain
VAINEDALYGYVGERLRRRRRDLGLTQSELATQVSMQRTSITNIELGLQHAPLHVLFELCRALRIEAAEILPDVEHVTASQGELADLATRIEEFGAPLSASILQELLGQKQKARRKKREQ